MIASHLVPEIGTADIKKAPTRNGFGDGLVEAGQRDEKVVALSADLTESTRTLPFADAFPNRFFQMGITEQNMASVASGMAAMDKIPFITSYAMFSPGRNWEQIRTTICYNNSNVKVIGAHAGVSVGPDGATHQALEDIALMRVVPNMTVLVPADVHEARKATLWAAKHTGPVYIRLGRSDTAIFTTPESPFTVGQASVFYTGRSEGSKRIGIVSTGQLSYDAVLAAIELEKKTNVSVSVLHMPCIKPVPKDDLLAFASANDVLLTVEEHQMAGGLGGAVTEFLSDAHPMRIVRVGVPDVFGQSGEPQELLQHYGLDSTGIIKTIETSLL